ncbi:UNVERIFIED_CONTAM: hypothetical protein FKN15_015609 [Acipenser sinensis]
MFAILYEAPELKNSSIFIPIYGKLCPACTWRAMTQQEIIVFSYIEQQLDLHQRDKSSVSP